MFHASFVKIGPIVLEKKMLMDNGSQTIAIVHPSDSGDLKIVKYRKNCRKMQEYYKPWRACVR